MHVQNLIIAIAATILSTVFSSSAHTESDLAYELIGHKGKAGIKFSPGQDFDRFTSLLRNEYGAWVGDFGKQMPESLPGYDALRKQRFLGFHGTSPQRAKSILSRGFRAGSWGSIGEGIYSSPDFAGAKRHSQGGEVIAIFIEDLEEISISTISNAFLDKYHRGWYVDASDDRDMRDEYLLASDMVITNWQYKEAIQMKTRTSLFGKSKITLVKVDRAIDFPEEE
jgi:hypothetical protein